MEECRLLQCALNNINKGDIEQFISFVKNEMIGVYYWGTILQRWQGAGYCSLSENSWHFPNVQGHQGEETSMTNGSLTASTCDNKQIVVVWSNQRLLRQGLWPASWSLFTLPRRQNGTTENAPPQKHADWKTVKLTACKEERGGMNDTGHNRLT